MSIELKSQHHLFRYASEWDPREKGKTKGGYLEGSIRLPCSEEGVRVVISTYPAHLPEGLEKECEYVHPTLIHLVRKTRARRMQELEPVPNIYHWKQELIVKGKEVDIVNHTSGADEGRNIPEQDKLFDLKDERVLPFGKEAGELNLIILIPKSDARAQGDDVTLNNLLSNRIENKDILARMDENFKGKKSVNLKQVKLRVEFYRLSDGSHISSDVSQTISDTASKQLGALDFHDATPLKSCEMGGRKVIMVAEFGLATDVEPRFQLFDDKWNRMKDKEDTWLKQPIDAHNQQQAKVIVFKESIIFITPDQPNLQMILEKGYRIMLGGRRKSDGWESRKKFPFTYVQHISNCFYCYLSPDGGEMCQNGKAKLPQKKEGPRPGRKKRKMSEADKDDVDMEPASRLGRQDSIATSHRTSTDSQITWSPNSDDSRALAGGHETPESGGGNSQPILGQNTFIFVAAPQATSSVGEDEARIRGGQDNGISSPIIPESQIYRTVRAPGSGQIDYSVNPCPNQAGNIQQSNIAVQEGQTGAIPKSINPGRYVNIHSTESDNTPIQELVNFATKTSPQIQNSLTYPDQVWSMDPTVPSPRIESPNSTFYILSPESTTTSPIHSMENHHASQACSSHLTPMTNINAAIHADLDNHITNICGATNSDRDNLTANIDDTLLTNLLDSPLFRDTDGKNLTINLNTNLPPDCDWIMTDNGSNTGNIPTISSMAGAGTGVEDLRNNNAVHQQDWELPPPLDEDIVQDGSCPQLELSYEDSEEHRCRRVRHERRDTITEEETAAHEEEGIQEETEQPGVCDRILQKFVMLPILFALLFIVAKWYYGDSLHFGEGVATTLLASAIIIVAKDFIFQQIG